MDQGSFLAAAAALDEEDQHHHTNNGNDDVPQQASNTDGMVARQYSGFHAASSTTDSTLSSAVRRESIMSGSVRNVVAHLPNAPFVPSASSSSSTTVPLGANSNDYDNNWWGMIAIMFMNEMGMIQYTEECERDDNKLNAYYVTI